VRGLAVQADGKIIVAGDFIELGGPPRSGLGRLNPDGTLDMGFDPAPDGYVLSVIVQPDTRILLGGGFATLSGQPRSGVGRLNSDGSLDEHFNADVNGGVLCLALQSDGKILVGGEFTMLDGQPRRNLGRLNSDGTIDAAFTAAASGWVSALAVQADGKILVGGAFTNLNDEEVGLMGRLNADGSLDESFSPGVRGPVPFGNPYVACLAVEPDGRILVGGWFGFPLANLFRVGDAAFSPQPNGPVLSLSLQTDGKILVGGSFGMLGGQARADIGRLHGNGNLDLAFDPGASDVVDSLVIQSDGKILAGGEFGGTLGILGGQMRRALGRLTSDGATRQTLTIDAGGTTARWTRSGPGPEVQTATLEWSTDGTNYALLGNGVRISSGWKFTELSLPLRESFYLRARGSAIGGQYNGCVSLIESVAQFYLPGTSPVLVALRLASADQFRFGFSYAPGIDFSVQASTNVALPRNDWKARSTAMEFAPRLYQFAEEAPEFPQRFYYLRSP